MTLSEGIGSLATPLQRGIRAFKDVHKQSQTRVHQDVHPIYYMGQKIWCMYVRMARKREIHMYVHKSSRRKNPSSSQILSPSLLGILRGLVVWDDGLFLFHLHFVFIFRVFDKNTCTWNGMGLGRWSAAAAAAQIHLLACLPVRPPPCAICLFTLWKESVEYMCGIHANQMRQLCAVACLPIGRCRLRRWYKTGWLQAIVKHSVSNVKLQTSEIQC